MSTAPKSLMTEEQYLSFERASEIRHEFLRGEIFAMAGATESHNLASGNLFVAVQVALRDKPCRAYTHDMRVLAPRSRSYMYPDIVVACPPIEFQDGKRDTLLNPQVVVEVLSPSTASYDRGTKFDLYLQSESLRQYVLVNQDEPRVMSYTRQSDGVAWLMMPLSGLEAVLEFPTLGLSVPLSEIYRNVEFPPQLTPEELQAQLDALRS
ncbi:MAG: Uma2 family endonuclease [Planctomycetia bacterium]|nr:Uma2 family endonuclease [Planctomycetia bacterium]